MLTNVLLIDDDMDEIELFRDILEEIDPGISYNYSTHPQFILNKLESNSIQLPDIIFLDINMPEMDGWECLAHLKSMPVVKNIPVVMYSTSSRDKDREQAIRLGAKLFITKHDNYKKFKKEVESILLSFEKYSSRLDRILRLALYMICMPCLKANEGSYEKRHLHSHTNATRRNTIISIVDSLHTQTIKIIAFSGYISSSCVYYYMYPLNQ